ncbi:MAG: polysaccharide deacetylase family protein [Bacteroidetes bacterium]|nr:polysaccharide deacetylase family protein [Bacteroidota bacterium]
MFSVRPPFILRIFDGKYLTCTIPEGEKVISLTFDDGPVPEVTPRVLGILAERNVLATFFCTGDNVKKHPDLFAQLLESGHAIGNHTFHHLNGWTTPPAEYFEDVRRCEEYFKTDLFRPPYGKFTPSQYFLLQKQYRIILWSVLSGDYHKRITKEQCLENVLKYTRSGSIVLFHDTLKAEEKLLYTLPRFLDHFLGEGYRFVQLMS